jgi:polysaccharide deacetylase family protein (PEP-CTERM system associated)
MNDMMAEQKEIFLTVDVEDGINILMRDAFGIEMEPTARVVGNVERLLELFEKRGALATFFILGEVAQFYPGLVKRIAAAGHEVGIHGFSHTLYGRMGAATIREEIVRTRGILEDLTGREVTAHRAPAFSVGPANPWALEVIAGAGIRVDSSIMPATAGRYGWPGFHREIVVMELPSGATLTEVPLTVASLPGMTFPAGGGGYLRYFPLFWTEYCFKRALRKGYAMVYMHPYETDTEPYPSQYYEAAAARGTVARLKSMLVQAGKKSVLPKLSALLEHYQGVPLGQGLSSDQEASSPRIQMATAFPGYPWRPPSPAAVSNPLASAELNVGDHSPVKTPPFCGVP